MDYKSIVLEKLETMKFAELGVSSSSSRFKALAYDKAIRAIRSISEPLINAEQIKEMPGIGEKIYMKIVEILNTGQLVAAEKAKQRTDIDAVKELLQIHGIGPVKARELISLGYSSVADLRNSESSKILNKTQLLGLKYYEDSLERIPRDEMIQHEHTLLSLLPTNLIGTIVGSYRRGASTSGDIDILITYHQDLSDSDAYKLFQHFIRVLEHKNYIVDTLASGVKKWLGYVQLPGEKVRRLDMLLTPPNEYAYSILYFTGSDKFNVAFRKWCLRRGYTLNEHTLLPFVPNLKTEEDIFDFMGLKYIPPQERIDGAQIIPK